MAERTATSGYGRKARSALRAGFAAVGARADERIPALRSFLVRGLTIFLFHEVTDSPSPLQRHVGLFTPTDLFIEQILWIRERFTVIKPTDLRQLGGDAPLPDNAAMVTFDDCWAGVFRSALPLLDRMNVPAICFLNMATIEGDPDLAAVRQYEELRVPSTERCLRWPVDATESNRILSEVRRRYANNPEFAAFQGPIATSDDLSRSAALSLASFGSHLYHHWEIRDITPGLYERSLSENLAALGHYSNSLPIFATPYGYSGLQDAHSLSVPQRLGYRVIMKVTGRQNVDPTAPVLDRLPLPIVRSPERDWWHASHRLRLLGWALHE